MEFGTANYSKDQYKKTAIAKIKDGNNVYRILPPMGSLAKNGKWNRYIAVEWGYKTTDGKLLAFQDVRVVNRKTKMVEQESAAHLRREELKALLMQKTEDLKSGKLSKDEFDKIKDYVDSFNLEKKYYVNAIAQNGDIVVLKIGYKAKQLLEAEIEKLMAKGVDPLSIDNGRFFNIYRAGRGLDTVYTVQVVSENIQHPDLGTVQREVVHKITDDLKERIRKESKDLLVDLDKLYVNLTPEQVQRVVSGKVNEVYEEVRGSSNANDVEAEDDGRDDEVAQTAQTASQATSQAGSQTATQNVASTEMKVDTSNIQQAAGGETVSNQAKETKTSTSNEDWLRSIGAIK